MISTIRRDSWFSEGNAKIFFSSLECYFEMSDVYNEMI